jgi:hypothetical protein
MGGGYVMSGLRRWRISLGPVSVLISTALPLDAEVTALASRGEPPMYALAAVPSNAEEEPGTASVVHRATAAGPAVVWDRTRASLLVTAAEDEIGAEELLHLAYLVLENRLQHSGYVTLHAAGACWQDQAVLLLGSAGAGKTTTLLRLCRDHAAVMIGNDLVLAGGPGEVPTALAGTRHLRLRHASVARVMPELLGLFPGTVTDSWRVKQTLPPARLGIDVANGPAQIRVTVFVHVDPGYPALVDEPGDMLVHRLNLYENALRYIRGGSTPWLAGGRFGPYVPPLDDLAAHIARTATLERLLKRARYVAGPPSAVAEHIAALFTGTNRAAACDGRWLA